ALYCTTIQSMYQQFNELCPTQTNNPLTTTDNSSLTSSYQRKKTKISIFFTYLCTENSENSNVKPNEFDRYCEISEISLDEGSCSLE
ncbi:29690_t:CDS:1, partial [Gigaspora margarita]